MRFIEYHTTKYSNPNNPKIEKECQIAFDYFVKNIDRFKMFIHDSREWMKNNNIDNNDIKKFVKSLSYDDCTFLDKDVLLDMDLKSDEMYKLGNELYVFIIADCKIKDFNGNIYLKFSMKNHLISFHEAEYNTIEKNRNFALESLNKHKEYYTIINGEICIQTNK